MKILILILALVVFYPNEEAHALTFEDQFHERLMEVGWKQSLLEADRYSLDERRYVLARALQAFGSDKIPRQPERQENFQKAQSTLLSIPGHAKYYQEKIEAMRAEVLVNSKKSEAEISKMQDEGIEFVDVWSYESFSVNAFRTLAHLPSPECVAVLGFYLNDPVGRDGKTLPGANRSNPGDDFDPRPINSEYAAIAIRKLGIEHPPFKLYDDRGLGRVREGEVDAWKDWWNEVKEGRRTYRFIGSSVEYGPDGPASKEVVQRVERDRKRDGERAVGHKKSTSTPASEAAITQTNKPYSLTWLIAAVGLIGAAVWYFVSGRKTT